LYAPQTTVNFNPDPTKSTAEEPGATAKDTVHCSASNADTSAPAIIGAGVITRNEALKVPQTVAGNADYRSGLEYGVLVVPFKVQLSGGKAITGSSTVGGYLGYDFPWMNVGVTFRPVIFAGLSPTSVPSSSGTSTSASSTSQTLMGLSYGFGVVSVIKQSSFQVGLICGFDHTDSTSYAYNDKPWLSFEIGYSFAQ
jgi:hypothetical protein